MTTEDRAHEIWLTCANAGRGLEWTIAPTDDGGFTVDAERAEGHDLLFAVSDSGHLYFTARGPRLRRAGIVADKAAVEKLARWLVGDADFPVDGLLIG